MGFLRAIARALAKLGKGTANFVWDMWDQTLDYVAMPFEYTGKALEWAGSKLGGGGGPAPARDMTQLPTASELREVQEVAMMKQAAKTIAADNAIEQVRRFAEADGPTRLTMPLTKLNVDQATWLVKLTEGQYDRLLEASDATIQDVLNGKPGLVPGLRSVGEKAEVLSPIGQRIRAFKERQVETELAEWRATREADNIRAA